MSLSRRTLALVLAGLLVSQASGQQAQNGLRLPPGFEVTEFADSQLANDIYTMTLDPQGRVVVAGRGYIRILLDRDGDGRADESVPFADVPREGAMGLLWEGKHLYCTGDGGLLRFTDADGDGKADRPPELLQALKTGGEHAAHAIRRGPDGWLYVLCGNNTDVGRLVRPSNTSPIRVPTAGCVLRFSPDFKEGEILAHGFRNPYDMDFNSDGELFTYDSDNERCVSLPWYEPTRFYHVRPGAHHGWLSPERASFWRMPPYFVDVSAPVCTLGRGSPTGCVCYRHAQFPEKYRGGFFLLDWTFGQVHFVSLKRQGKGYEGTPEVFLRSVGDNGFAPTAAVVHPGTGDLFVSIGGRGTRGAVYRIRYPAGLKTAAQEAKRWQFRPRQAPAYEVPSGREGRPAATATPENQKLWLQAARTYIRDLRAKETPREQKLVLIRYLQQLVGDEIPSSARGSVWEGYARTRPSPDSPAVEIIRSAVRELFPLNLAAHDRELSRLLAILEDGERESLEKVVRKLTAESDPIEDIHYLIVLARLKAPRGREVRHAVATALLALDEKIARRRLNRDSNWQPRMIELHRELARKDPGLNEALLEHREFGRPEHAVWAQALGIDRRRAARLFLSRAARERDFAWNAGIVQLIGALPESESLPVLRKLWDQAGLNEVILPLLARRPSPEDRERFLSGLRSPSLAVVRQSLAALEALPPHSEAADLFALVQAMRLLPEGKEEEQTRASLGRLLRKLTRQNLSETDREAWVEWFRKTYPREASKLGGEDGVDEAGWTKRLAGIDWSRGDAERGRELYRKASCAACHSGSQAMGPDLVGVANRFSRADLFTAILRPSKDVPARYRTTTLTTEDGKSYQGLIIYEAVDSVILQTGPAMTLRLAHRQIAEKRIAPQSLMPVGLLDRMRDEDIADLYAYLRNLVPGRK